MGFVGSLRIALLSTLLVLAFACAAFGQVATGIPPFSSFSTGAFDIVNNANLNVHFKIPIINKPGRGLPFAYFMAHDNSLWVPVVSGGMRA